MLDTRGKGQLRNCMSEVMALFTLGLVLLRKMCKRRDVLNPKFEEAAGGATNNFKAKNNR